MIKSNTLPSNKSDHRSHPRPSSGQRLIVHYNLNGHAVCEAEHLLTANTRFLEIPLPVLHRMMMGRMT